MQATPRADEAVAAPTVEVLCVSAADAEAAEAGGADRIHLCAMSDGEPRSVEPVVVGAVVRATGLPVRVTLRLSAGASTQGGEFARLVGLAAQYLSVGAEGCVFGFLTRELEVDAQVCRQLAEALAGAPWTFDTTFDAALDARQAWRALRGIPGLDAIHTAGALTGAAAGIDDLLRHAGDDAGFAEVAVAAGGVRPSDVPWLLRAGIRRVHVGAEVRPGGSWTRARVDAGFVRSWRLLLDAESASTGRSGLRPTAGDG